MEIDNQIFAAVEAARARQLAEARYSEQRRQALAAILYGVVIMVLVIAAAGGWTWILLALGDRSRRASVPGIDARCAALTSGLFKPPGPGGRSGTGLKTAVGTTSTHATSCGMLS